MPQMIKIGGGLFSKGELLRINPGKNTIEVSTNGGRSWSPRCANSTSYGTFRDLPTRPLTETSSAFRSMAASCSPTPVRGCTTPGMEEGGG